MNHWWRAYNEAVNDPKLQLISDSLFRAWFNLMCIASGNDGALPAVASLAFTLRMKPEKVGQVLTQLHAAGLLDKTETGFVPHNWKGRQYKSDKADETAAERMARYRERKRNERNAAVTVTAPREQTTEQKDSEPIGSGASAPLEDPSEPEREYFARGRKVLGKSAGGQLAKLLKANGGNVSLSRSTLELAATKHNPAEFFARAVAPSSQGPPPGRGGFTSVLMDKHRERQHGTSDSEPEFLEH